MTTSAATTNDKAWALFRRCQKFIKDEEIHGPETIYQCDGVIENAYDFIKDVCDIVGYCPVSEEEKNS